MWCATDRKCLWGMERRQTFFCFFFIFHLFIAHLPQTRSRTKTFVKANRLDWDANLGSGCPSIPPTMDALQMVKQCNVIETMQAMDSNMFKKVCGARHAMKGNQIECMEEGHFGSVYLRHLCRAWIFAQKCQSILSVCLLSSSSTQTIEFPCVHTFAYSITAAMVILCQLRIHAHFVHFPPLPPTHSKSLSGFFFCKPPSSLSICVDFSPPPRPPPLEAVD